MFRTQDNFSNPCSKLRALLARSVFLFAFHAVMASCSTVPDADKVIDQSTTSNSSPQVVGAQGPLTARQSKALFTRLGLDLKNSDVLKRHLAIEEEVAGGPLVAGNATRLLRDGDQTFRAIFEAIRGAKRHVNLEYYILEDVEYQGQKLSALLLAKRQEGVSVNIIYDSIGSIKTSKEFFDRLKRAGVKLVEFNSVNPLVSGIRKSPNNRDHRKIMIVDGHIGIVGGINLSVTYQSALFENSSKSNTKAEHWRDTDLEIRGPAVAGLQKLFFDQWYKHKGEMLGDAGYFPLIEPKGTEMVRVIGSTPDDAISRYYITLLSAIRTAEKSIWLTNGYFVPTPEEKQDLIDAAQRGVDVRLLMPDKTDTKPALAIQHSHYTDLLEAGVKIYETRNIVLHAKTVVIDGVWSVVGSSNLDHRSVLYNDEVDVVVLGTSTGKEVERMFEEDVAKANQIELAKWKKRPLLKKLNEFFSRFLQNLL